jgi:hypothetical protein
MLTVARLIPAAGTFLPQSTGYFDRLGDGKINLG